MHCSHLCILICTVSTALGAPPSDSVPAANKVNEVTKPEASAPKAPNKIANSERQDYETIGVDVVNGIAGLAINALQGQSTNFGELLTGVSDTLPVSDGTKDTVESVFGTVVGPFDATLKNGVKLVNIVSDQSVEAGFFNSTDKNGKPANAPPTVNNSTTTAQKPEPLPERRPFDHEQRPFNQPENPENVQNPVPASPAETTVDEDDDDDDDAEDSDNRRAKRRRLNK